MGRVICKQILKRLDHERIPQVAVLSSVFFVASLVHFPVGPSSVHLILNGLVGVMLGWAAFPAILVALLLQTVLFGFGGLVVLGVNVMNMALPAVLCRALFLGVARHDHHARTTLAAGAAGALGVLLTALMVSLALALSGKEFQGTAKLVVLTHLPVMVIEAVFSAAAIGLFVRIRPEFLGLTPMRNGLPTIATLVAVILWLAASGTAQAHKLKAFAAVEGTNVSGYAYFSPGGDRIHQATVTVTAPDGSVIATMPADDEGKFRFVATRRIDYRITVEGGDGHVATYTVPATELPDSLPEGEAFLTAAEKPTPSVPPAAPQAVVAPIELTDLRTFIDQSVARQIRPLREQIDAYQEKIWLHDVLGGLGIIFGIGGLAYGLAERHCRKRALQGDNT